MNKQTLLAAGLILCAGSASAEDFGVAVEKMLNAQVGVRFGFEAGIGPSAGESPEEGYRQPAHLPTDSIILAKGLKAEFLSRDVANDLDMMAFYPLEKPTHLIACIESDREFSKAADGALKFNPSVQRIDLATGKVETILRGMAACDGIRTTPWNTVLATEEEDDGKAYELLKPLETTNETVMNRASGETTSADIAVRLAMPTMAWEGFTMTREGVVYGGDELRPGTAGPEADGGALYKFIPAAPWTGQPVTTLDASPFAAGKTYAFRASCQGDKVQYGQGCEIGAGDWIEIEPADARADADAKGATGFYRPEDLHTDPLYAGEGIRFCFANTGNEAARNYAEVICAVDQKPLEIPTADAKGKVKFTTVFNRFVEGDADFNSFDNLDFQPGTGTLYVVEDHSNGDIFACLPDGADRDIKTDGCVKMLSVKDTSAEPTGFIFDASGTVAYVSIQHSDDKAMPKVDGFATDDLIRITGFKK
ncbi:alkaline phosphatase PhoX [Chthonobacter albigriseus]|uniref:alkaline phosphatase PhoX n=1 Tax=Chthonobacter albigriseus TaxID=1683161 RepID=UPI0015EF183A|nr:alkaline phosphatase PhoX [Chthonobacter albigriseus]